jgi:hypothetical protein
MEKKRLHKWIDNIGFLLIWFTAAFIFVNYMVPQCTVTELYDGKIKIDINK